MSLRELLGRGRGSQSWTGPWAELPIQSVNFKEGKAGQDEHPQMGHLRRGLEERRAWTRTARCFELPGWLVLSPASHEACFFLFFCFFKLVLQFTSFFF